MGCTLKAEGTDFLVDTFLEQSGLSPAATVFRKGEPEFPRTQPSGRVWDSSRMSIRVDDRGVATGANTSDCSVGKVHFACPKNFKPVPLDSTQQFVLYYWKKYDVGVFVASPASGYDESTFMTNVIRTSLAKMFPKDSQTFSWKGVPYSGRISKFEIDGSVVQGFNGSLGVLIKYRRLKLNGPDIIVGYTSEFGRGAEVKESFARGLGGDSMPGCYAVVETIYSITGEKMPENNPCDLIGEIR